MKHRAVLLAATSLFTGCASLAAGSDGTRRLGVIESRDLHAPVLSAPDSVTAGTEFQVTVTTGSYSNWTEDRTHVSAGASQAVIRPFYRVYGACISLPQSHTRSVRLRFDHPGTATIVVQGLREDGFRTGPTQIRRTVVVR
jgi:hypothetical protein